MATQVDIAPGLGQRIRQLRSRLVMNQAEFAELVGCHPESVHIWERRGGSPTAKHLRAIAGATGVSLAWLVRGKE